MLLTSTLVCVVIFVLSFHDFCSAASPPMSSQIPTLPRTKLPNEDPFYTPPKGFEAQPLGAILRSRPVPNGITVDNIKTIKLKTSWQILYRTQNSVGEPEATVTTVLIPQKAASKKLLTFIFFSVGFNVAWCSFRDYHWWLNRMRLIMRKLGANFGWAWFNCTY